MTEYSAIEPDVFTVRNGPFQVNAWAYVPAFLLLHGIVATCLPSRLNPLSTIFIVLTEVVAIWTCLKAARGTRGNGAIFWLLFAVAILIHSMAMSLDAAAEIARAPILNHVPAIQVFLSMLHGVLLLVAVSIQNDRRIPVTARIIHASLSIAIGALIYLEIFGFLTVYGTRSSTDEVLVTHLFDVMDFFLAVTGTVRWLGASQDEERRFFQVLATFLWLNAIFPAIHNRILMRHDYIWLDLLISAPYAILVPLIFRRRSQKKRSPSAGFTRMIRSGSPALLAGGLVLVGFVTARSHFYIGLTSAFYAIAGYGTFNIFVQSSGLETEDWLMASNAALEKLVELDALTGIANRRAFNDALNREFTAATRTLQPVSLLMIDVDHFKQLNDSIGHVAGDEYLIQIATELRRTLPRATDFVARYGGEEFAAILPATDACGAIVAAERARKGVAGLGLKHPAAAAGVITISIGVSTYDGSVLCTSADLTESADRALYRAKRTGRNRSEVCSMEAAEHGVGISAVS